MGKTSATAAAPTQDVQVIPPVIVRFTYSLKGIGRGLLLCNPAGSQENRPTPGGRTLKVPEAEQFERARYMLKPARDGATDGVPAVGFIAAMKRQAMNNKQGTQVMGVFWAEPEEDGLLPLLDAEAKALACFPRTSSGAPKVIRAHYPTWRVELPLAFIASVKNKNEVAQFLLDAGIRVGVGCQRPERDQAAGFGRFTFEISE